jgi:hypothetical protein
VPSLMRIVPASVLAAAIALSAAACSSSGSSGSATPSASSLAGTPDQIVQKAISDLKTASSVQLSGTVDSAGTNSVIDLTSAGAQDCKGTIMIHQTAAAASSSKAETGSVDLIEVGGTVYAKPSDGFFNNLGLSASDISEVTGKYVKATANSDLAGFADLCGSSFVAASFYKHDETGFVSDGTATINGQATEVFKQPAADDNGIVYISVSSTPEIARISGPGSEGSVNFTNYNAPVTITAPPASEVIDGSKFGL